MELNKRYNTAINISQIIIVSTSIVIIFFSFFQPAFYIDRADYDAWADSKLLFFLGWMSLLGGNFTAFSIWLANPIFIASVILILSKRTIGLAFSVIACLIALSFSCLDSIMTSESGSYSKITSLENGYKLWVLSMLVLATGTGIITLIQYRIKITYS